MIHDIDAATAAAQVKSDIDSAREVMAAMSADAELQAAVAAVALACVKALRGGGKVLFCGNGGSAADAQHLAGEFVSRFHYDRHPLAAMALTTDSSVMTAIGNDYGYDKLFERQVLGLGRPGDVLIGISTSGRSPNVLLGLTSDLLNLLTADSQRHQFLCLNTKKAIFGPFKIKIGHMLRAKWPLLVHFQYNVCVFAYLSH